MLTVEIGERPTQPKVVQMYALLAVHEGKEGLIGSTGGGSMMIACVATEDKLLPHLRKTAADIAKNAKMTVKLVRFTAREDIEEFKP